MANIKSAKKRVIVNRTKAERNKAIRSEVKTSIKKVEAAVAAKDLAAAQAALKVATATIESACSKGVYHKNNAARSRQKNFVFVCFIIPSTYPLGMHKSTDHQKVKCDSDEKYKCI